MKNNHIELEFKLSTFDGPIDLLYKLIEKEKISILDINLVDLADQYINFIEVAEKDVDLDKLAEYHTYITYFTKIKTKAILKLATDKPIEDNDENKEELLEQLFKYEQYKKCADSLNIKQKQRLNLIDKDSESYKEYKNNTIFNSELESIDPFNLMEIFESLSTSYAIEESKLDVEHDFFHKKIQINALSITNVMEDIINHFQQKNLTEDDFFNCFKCAFNNDISKLNFCYFYLALLILIKHQIIKVKHDDNNFPLYLLFLKENISNIKNHKE